MFRANPGLIEPSVLECLETGGTDCGGEPLGLLKECSDRVRECDVWDDLCLGVFLLQPKYKAQIPECLALGCAQVETCVYGLIGIPPE